MPVLVCESCKHRVALPYRQFLASSVLQPYWPSHQAKLEWICDACGRRNLATQEDLGWFAASSLPPPVTDRGFWRVQVPCPARDCTLSHVAYVQTFGQTSRRNLGLMLAMSTPPPLCSQGHALFPERSYPSRIDFIEWTGTRSHLT